MEHPIADLQYCEAVFSRFYDVGSLPSGGVTRLGYTETEDEMHRIFTETGRELGYDSIQDEVGNTFVGDVAGRSFCLVGSHLDSVIEGGRYDGVAGILAGLMILRWAKEDNLNLPIRVGAFRCEESSNFGCCTIGSGLVTRELRRQDVANLKAKSGETLESIFRRRGYSLNPPAISGLMGYFELHIEQGKVLEETRTDVGIVQTIAGPRRFKLYLRGVAEHSGATPMAMRSDALCAAAELILEIERIGNKESLHQSVATVGVVQNQPNAMNVVPGEVELGVDIRGIDLASLDRIEYEMKDAARRICARRHIEYMEEKLSEFRPVDMSRGVQLGLEDAAQKLGISSRRMMSGAGHDAMAFPSLCPTGMVFIPCQRGVSHNRAEFAHLPSICDGARVIYEFLKGEAL
ncbi:Zn-dependent hydrolase [Pseudoflavonifractor sp. 60]|uniref:hydantoinase/carbamoylase family amidase n=1 Tax=Pseudoflavonifractor sp. 60 TaxID=2304576 RepID=UPI001369E22E|nr:hydantoinase/carbamoylase family amidase [Pseudoflavonifractor sp. 60]NBI67651.1 Zn-dependent hydrolase [Pseudoflavonifractor sp. 60]